jgi:adenylate kinase family enzyme
METNNKKFPVIVNLFGAPGSGKSTGASYIFSKLKLNQIDAELVREVAKDLIYAKNTSSLSDNQYYVSALQYKRLNDVMTYGTKFIITDCPLILQLEYGKNMFYYSQLAELIKKINSEYNNFNVLIQRIKPFDNRGRIHNEQQADFIHEQLLKNYLFDLSVFGNEGGYDYIVEHLLKINDVKEL